MSEFHYIPQLGRDLWIGGIDAFFESEFEYFLKLTNKPCADKVAIDYTEGRISGAISMLAALDLIDNKQIDRLRWLKRTFADQVYAAYYQRSKAA